MTLPGPVGTTPNGETNEQQAARWVQDMFARVAPTYDFLNHLLSFRIDRGWRKALTQSLAEPLARPNAQVLDLCCGTADVLLDLQAVAPSSIVGADFCHPMLVAAQKKISQHGFRSPLFEADALSLPLRDNALDAIAISFGFRNLANYESGLAELYRVLKPGGRLAILEFSHPSKRLTRTAYGFYSRCVLPTVGRLISGSTEAYSYLPESIRKFPSANRLAEMMTQAGFQSAHFRLLTGGIAALHTAAK